MPLGDVAFRVARRLVHIGRKVAHPNVPTNLRLTHITFQGKRLTILHRRSSIDRGVIQQRFKERQYDLPAGFYTEFMQRTYEQILVAGRQPLIVDCGANIGASVLLFATRYPRAHILAIEPAPDNFELLSRNCAGLDVDLRQAGISNLDGVLRLDDPGEGPWGYRTTSTGKGPEIPMIAFKTLLASKPGSRYQPFFLKIDIEGAEKTLFDSDPSCINQFPIIAMEPHDWLLPGEGSSLGFFRFQLPPEGSCA